MRRIRTWSILAAAATLSGCAHTASPMCLPFREYTREEQGQLAGELAALPPGSAVASAMVDYERMRDADRACRGAPARP